MTQDDSALYLREPYFKPISLDDSEVFCIDDRFSNHPLYIKVPGGIAFFYNNLAIMRQIENNNVKINISGVAADIIDDVIASGLKFGIHSDDTHEHKSSISLSSEDKDLGCGYISKRAVIIANIAKSGPALKKEITDIFPDILKGQDENFEKIIKANQDLLKGDYLNLSPRENAKTVIEAGAKSMIVEGQHAPNAIAILNLMPNSTLDTAEAAKNKVPAYNYDAWAFSEAIKKLPKLYGFDSQVQELAALIDFLATSQLLGVKEVYVRS